MQKTQLPPIANEQTFEELILKLFNYDYPNSFFQHFGKKGNNQKGIDIISTQTGVAIQCKLKERTRTGLLNKLKQDFLADLKKIILLKPKIQQLIFVSTFDDNAALIEYLQSLKEQMRLPFDVTYQGWQTLSAAIQYHPELLKQFFPQYFTTRGTLLTPVPFFDIHQMQDREHIFNELDEHTKENRVLVIEGIGGSGKTIALSCYVNENKDKYDHVIWAECSLASVRESILTSMPIPTDSDNKNRKPIERWLEFCQKLLSTKGKNLIVVDGIEHLDQHLYNVIDDLAATGWHVIITSRIKLQDYPIMQLSGLTPHGAEQLFRKYFTKYIDDSLLQRLIQLLGNHPLLIELVAKAGSANKKMSPQQLYTLLTDNNLKSKEFQCEINVGKHSRKYTENRHQYIYEYLLLCFDISDLNKTEQQQLLFFSVFPVSQPVRFDDFMKTTGQERKKLSIIENALNKLEITGWIANRDEAYYIHPLIQAIAWEKLAISTKKIKSMVLGCTKQLAAINRVNPWSLSNTIATAKNILHATELTVESLYLNLLYATALMRMGDDAGAIPYFLKCEDFAVKNFITEPEFLGGLFNNLGISYKSMGRYGEAASYLLMAIQAKEAAGIEDQLSYAISLDNYATVLEASGHYKESIKITKEAIRIFREEGEQRYLCQAYINLANTYYHLNDFDKAKAYCRRGNALLEADYDAHLISSAFNTLGIILQAQNKNRLAKQAFIIGIKAHKESPNPDILSLLYSNLSLAQFRLQQFEKGKRNLIKAIKLNDSINGDSRYNTARLYELSAKYSMHENAYGEAVQHLNNALKIFQEIFDRENDNCTRVKEELRLLHKGAMDQENKSVYANNMFYAVKEFLYILHKHFQSAIDRYGVIKGLRSKSDAAFIYDYMFFCATKGCKSFASIITLIENEKAEDALILLYSVYRNYLTAVFLKSQPEAIDFFIQVPIEVEHGQIKRPQDEEGLIEVTQIIDDGEELPFYPTPSRLVKMSPYPEDKSVHNYLNIQLSDHVYTNFMTSGNYRDDKGKRYRYNGNNVIVQPVLIGTYLQIILLQELMSYINDPIFNKKISKIIEECKPILIALIEFGNIDITTKKAMKDRLVKY